MRMIFILFSSCLLLVSCSDERSSQPEKSNRNRVEKVERNFTQVQIKRGRQLFLKNCTVCHGINGEGSPDWQKRLPDGSYPPPPLNGTGHAWHHPKKVLVDTIKHGTARLGGKMPAWKDKLSEQDINAIIAWFQSQWPDELYQAWQRMDQAKSNN